MSLEKLRSLAANTKLAPRRLMSDSQGPGKVSSKSLISKTRVRSGVAKTPKFERWQSPQACTLIPDTGEFARSCAWMIAVPRKNLNGDSDILSYRRGIRPGMRPTSDCCSSFMGSSERDLDFHSACEVRGHFSRRAFPCACLSFL